MKCHVMSFNVPRGSLAVLWDAHGRRHLALRGSFRGERGMARPHNNKDLVSEPRRVSNGAARSKLFRVMTRASREDLGASPHLLSHNGVRHAPGSYRTTKRFSS